MWPLTREIHSMATLFLSLQTWSDSSTHSYQVWLLWNNMYWPTTSLLNQLVYMCITLVQLYIIYSTHEWICWLFNFFWWKLPNFILSPNFHCITVILFFKKVHKDSQFVLITYRYMFISELQCTLKFTFIFCIKVLVLVCVIVVFTFPFFSFQLWVSANVSDANSWVQLGTNVNRYYWRQLNDSVESSVAVYFDKSINCESGPCR